MKNNLLLILVLTLIVFVIFSGIGFADEAGGKISVVYLGSLSASPHPYLAKAVTTIEDLLKNATFVDKYTFLNAEEDMLKASILMDQAIALDPDVLVINAFDAKGFVESIKRAHQAGIKVVTSVHGIIDKTGWDYIVADVTPDSFDQGYNAGELAIEGAKSLFDDDLSGRTAIVLMGYPFQTGAVLRTQGFYAAISDADVGIEILESKTAHWSKDEAITVMETMYAKYGQIDIVFGNNDSMALGAVIAAEKEGVLADTIIVGVDGTPEALQSIKDGLLYGVVYQNPISVAEGVFEVVQKIAAGEDVPFINVSPAPKINANNVSEFEGIW
ncbi:MAG: sugar ABC transporter substrate-binding protein [Parcubacteria group bacterium]|nr:sugar ABC transporter substrate-binding protein [Parcubacteria group bacterium]